MRPAGHFDDAAAGACVNAVVSTEGISLEVTRIIRQKLRGATPLAIDGEVVDVVRQRRRADLDPETPLVAA
jgi:hypothetical protein